MKLAEALMARNDLKAKLQRVNEEIMSIIITEEDVENEFAADEKIREFLAINQKLNELNVSIDRANKENIIKLQALRKLDRDISMLKTVRTNLLGYEKKKTNIYGGSDSSSRKKNISLVEVTEMLEASEIERRKLDRELQAINWQTEI